jgi:uncharacterized protein (TIGR03086 family)
VTPRDRAAELLDRALTYTRMTLDDVTEADLGRRTPCAGWDLGQLLAHMEDGLDAFAEGARGAVDLADRVPARVRVGRLQEKACALRTAWSGSAPPATVRIGGHPLDTHVVALAAALEITVHGWDVGRAVGIERPVPRALAEGLLPVASALVTDADRGDRFGEPRPVDADAPAAQRLLAFLGRDTRPGMSLAANGQIPRNRRTGGAAAS